MSVYYIVHVIKHIYKHTIPAFTHAGLHGLAHCAQLKHVCLNVSKVFNSFTNRKWKHTREKHGSQKHKCAQKAIRSSATQRASAEDDPSVCHAFLC